MLHQAPGITAWLRLIVDSIEQLLHQKQAVAMHLGLVEVGGGDQIRQLVVRRGAVARFITCSAAVLIAPSSQ